MNRVQLTNNATYDYFPDYSPDGGRIAYSAFGEKHSRIYTIRARGGGKAKVAEGGDDPDYSPDGKKIVYYKGNDLHGKIYTINLGGGGKSKVTEGSNPAWGVVRSGFSSGRSQQPRGLGEVEHLCSSAG